MSIFPPSSASTPRIEYLSTVRSDDESIVELTFACHFPSQPVITSRLCHVLLVDNPDLPEVPESLIVRWDVDFDDEDDLENYRGTINRLVNEHIGQLLAGLPHSALLRAPRDPVFVAVTTLGADHIPTIGLHHGLPDSLRRVETACLRRLKETGTVDPESIPGVPIHDIDTVLVLGVFDTGSRDIMRVLLPDNNIGVMQWIPTVVMLLSPSGTPVMEAGTLHEMEVLRSIPPHPNIVGPPIAYISRQFEGSRLICGFVQRFLRGGCVRNVIADSAVALSRRAKWAYQISSALRHIHRVARTYHGDVKLDNVVLDEDDNAVLIDFEQGRANEEAAAPELHAGGTVTLTDQGRLVYHTFGGSDDPPRLANRAYPYDAWLHVPRAIEAAEVHALGVAFARLFGESEVPSDIIARCQREDPNDRPTLDEIEQYFREWSTSLQE
ncbi:kinase-like protein [Trametes elegans]|nr:kinase-like protein [Trametes elegans]